MLKLFLQASLSTLWDRLSLQGKWQQVASAIEADALICKDSLDEETFLQNPLMPQIIIGKKDSVLSEFSCEMSTLNDIPVILESLEEIISKSQTLHNKKIPYKNDLFHTVLAFIWTRGGYVKAHLSHTLTYGYGYPFIEKICKIITPPPWKHQNQQASPIVGLLNHLEKLKLLSSHIVERAHSCPSCASLNIILRDGCSQCHSPHINKHSIVHHFKCAYQAAQHHFIRNTDKIVEFICPHCHEELIHFGVDYDKPGEVFLCENCHYESSDTVVVGRCLNCQFSFRSNETAQCVIKDYILTALGHRAVLSLSSDIFSQIEELADEKDLISYAEFLRHTKHLSSYKERYGLEGLILSIQISQTQDEGQTLEDETLLRTIGKTILRDTREGDLISVHDGHIFILMMGAQEDTKEQAIEHIQQLIHETFNEDISDHIIIEEYMLENVLKDQEH